MRPCRILSLWFPRLAAERLLRAEPRLAGRPLAVVADRRGALVLGEPDGGGRGGGAPARHGARRRAGDPARARHPSRRPGRRRPHPRRAAALGRALLALGRRGGAEALVLDVTGCAQLFGGEAGLVDADRGRGGRLRLHPPPRPRRHPRRGLGGGALRGRERARPPMPATRSTRRRAPPARARRSGAGSAAGRRRRAPRAGAAVPGIVPPGATLAHLGPLPVAALRLEPETVERLQALGLGRIGDARGAAARRDRPPLRPRGRAAARPGARPDARAGLAGAARAGLRAAPDLPRADRPRRGRPRRHRPAAAAARRPAPRPPARARAGCG